MRPLVRSAVLSNFVEVAHRVGVEPHPLIARAGLKLSCLNQWDMKVAAAAVNRLLELAADSSKVENFGLRMAETRRLSVLGRLGMVARDASTLRELLGFLFQHMSQHNEALHVRIEDLYDKALIRVNLMIPQTGSVRQSIELTLGAIARIIKLYLGEDWQPRRAYFSHDKPQDVRLHGHMFGPFLSFATEFNGLLLDQSDLDKQLLSADPAMANYSRQLWKGATQADTDQVGREVRHLILILMPEGRCSIERVAGHMGVVRQTVHRKLMLEGLQFSGLLQEIRLELSDCYLQQPGRSLAQIALLLGFSELSGYSRWHQKSLQETPTVRRRRLLARQAVSLSGEGRALRKLHSNATGDRVATAGVRPAGGREARQSHRPPRRSR